MAKELHSALYHHLSEIKAGKRRFENAFQGVARMILDSTIKKVNVNGKSTYDFSIFRTGKKHVIGMYDEINSFVSYVKDAAEGGSSKEMAFVLVGEPGMGRSRLLDEVALRLSASEQRRAGASDSNRHASCHPTTPGTARCRASTPH